MLPTRDDLFNVGADDIIQRADGRTTGRQFTADQIYLEGSDVNLLIAGTSAMGEEVVRQAGSELNALTLDGAFGDDLDRWIADRYGPDLPRKEASPSVGVLRFTRTSTGAGAVNYLSGSIVQTESGVRFELLQTASFTASSLGPVDVNARAVNAGIGGNVAAGTIVRAVTAFPDPTMLVTNPSFFSGGDDTESDDSYKSRARRYFPAARRGVKSAIENGALRVAGVREAVAEEVLDSNGNITGPVYLYIADANGQANQSLIDLVQIELLDFRALGIPVFIFSSIPVYVSIVLLLRYQSTVNSADALEQVKDTIVAQVSTLAPNQTLEVALLIEACKSVTGVIVLDDAIVSPTGDVVPTAGQLLRTRKDLISTVTS